MLLMLMACAKVEPAPEDLDGIFHYFWLHAEDGTPEQINEATLNLEAQVAGASLEDPLKGSVTDLSAEEVAVVEMDVDPSIAAGIFFVNPVVCTTDQIEKITYWQDQREIYPDYSEYDRQYTSSLDDYLARTTDTITWDTSYKANYVGAGDFTSRVLGSMRRVETEDFGPVLIIRAWIPEPAVFENGKSVFDQDFQLEIYYERDERLIHTYPIWRHLEINDTLNTDNEGFQGLLINSLLGYDDDNEKLCEEGKP